jgi:alkylation response protein AidB-like acyl-CoA dehydrogenase
LNTGRIGASKRELASLKRYARSRLRNGRSLMEDQRFADRVADLEIDLMALEITNLRFLDQLRGGKPPGAGVSMLKIRGTEIQQRLTELAMEAGDADAMRISDADGEPARFAATLGLRYCNFRKTSIYAGSNEIQRNIMAKMMLGL